MRRASSRTPASASITRRLADLRPDLLRPGELVPLEVASLTESTICSHITIHRPHLETAMENLRGVMVAIPHLLGLQSQICGNLRDGTVFHPARRYSAWIVPQRNPAGSDWPERSTRYPAARSVLTFSPRMRLATGEDAFYLVAQAHTGTTLVRAEHIRRLVPNHDRKPRPKRGAVDAEIGRAGRQARSRPLGCSPSVRLRKMVYADKTLNHGCAATVK